MYQKRKARQEKRENNSDEKSCLSTTISWWDILTYRKPRFYIQEMIKVAKNLIIRSSSTEILIFERQTHDKGIQVRFEDGDLWLTQKAIGELFNVDRIVDTKHNMVILVGYRAKRCIKLLWKIGLQE